jgi:hypothetical protein
MCGIDFVTPFQGLNLFGERCSQGVALGCLVLRRWRGRWRPERPEQECYPALRRWRGQWQPEGPEQESCTVLFLWRGQWQPEGLEQESPGQSEASPRVDWLKELFALKGQNNFRRYVAMTHIPKC